MSESPEKAFESKIISKFKEFYNKSNILGEKMNWIPSIIAPVYLGIRKIIIQEKSKFDEQRFNDDGTLFIRKSYKDYFCEKAFDATKTPTGDELFNDNNDVEELFRNTQKFIDKTKHLKIKKRKSYALRMSETHKPSKKGMKTTSGTFIHSLCFINFV